MTLDIIGSMMDFDNKWIRAGGRLSYAPAHVVTQVMPGRPGDGTGRSAGEAGAGGADRPLLYLMWPALVVPVPA